MKAIELERELSMLRDRFTEHFSRLAIIKHMVADYRSGWDESSVGIEPVTIEDILKAVEAL